MSESRKIIKRFIGIVEQEEIPTEELDFDNMSLASLSDKVLSRIERKPMADKCELYKNLMSALMSEMQNMPQGERKILNAFKMFKKEMM